MKKLNFLGAMAMTAILFTSCLGEGSNERSGVSIGVIDFSTEVFKNLAYVDNYNAIYSSQFELLNPGDCIVFPYTINYDEPVNNGANKYLTATVSGYHKLDKGEFSTVVDTTNASIQKGEVTTIDAAVISGDGTGYGYGTIKDFLFFGSSHPNTAEDQSNTYVLQCDPSQTPQSVEGKNVYDFFLRIIKNADGKGITGTATLNYVFRVGSTIEALKSKEKADGNDALYIRLNYIKEFNKDTTEATWGMSGVLNFPILKDNV